MRMRIRSNPYWYHTPRWMGLTMYGLLCYEGSGEEEGTIGTSTKSNHHHPLNCLMHETPHPNPKCPAT